MYILPQQEFCAHPFSVYTSTPRLEGSFRGVGVGVHKVLPSDSLGVQEKKTWWTFRICFIL